MCMLAQYHWRIQWGGGVRDVRPHPGGPNSFIFMQFSGKILKKIIALLGVGAPPFGKILDPPLSTISSPDKDVPHPTENPGSTLISVFRFYSTHVLFITVIRALDLFETGFSWGFFWGGGRQLPKSAIILQIFCQKTAWKWKNLDPQGGACPWRPLPWIRQCR